MASSDDRNGALRGTCSSLKLKLVPRMIEMGSHVEAAWLGAETKSMACLCRYIAVSEDRMPAVLQLPHG